MNQTKKDAIDVLEQYRGLTFKLESFGAFELVVFFPSMNMKCNCFSWILSLDSF